MQTRQAAQQPSTSGKLQGLAQAALRYARARLDLLQHEWEQEQSRLLGLLVKTLVFAFAALTTYQLIAAAIIVSFWDTRWRIHAVLVLAALTAGLAAYAWHLLRDGGRRKPHVFSLTLDEFEKDRTALATITADNDEPDQAKQQLEQAVARLKSAATSAVRQAKSVSKPVSPATGKANGAASTQPEI